MAYKRIILGDANIVRFWQASQLARPQLMGVTLKPVSCLDTLDAALGAVNDELDYALVSIVTSMLIDGVSVNDLEVSSHNIIEAAVKRLVATARKSARV